MTFMYPIESSTSNIASKLNVTPKSVRMSKKLLLTEALCKDI